MFITPRLEISPALGLSAYKPDLAAGPMRLPLFSAPILAAQNPALRAIAFPDELPHECSPMI
jgi:hypothetical protein